MASVEFLNKRIAGKEQEVAKWEKKLDRIKKAQDFNWENNPYYYSEYDLKCTLRYLDQARQALENYKKQLTQEQDKAASRTVKPILEFLENWKCRVKDNYINSLPKYLEAREQYYTDREQYTTEHPDWFREKAGRAGYRELENNFHRTWNWIREYVQSYDTLNLEKLEKDLNREADAKYDKLLEQVISITGQITDVSNLKVGEKGELNGYVLGEKGKAKVQTIGAGGYNIQCFHFRTLVRKMK